MHVSPYAARTRRITEVLVSNGLAVLAGQLGLAERAPETLRRRILAAGGTDAAAMPGPVRLRHALEELGPVFVKLGQMLSTRDDLLPSAYTTELRHLQDATRPVAFSEIAETIREEFGRDVEDAYAHIDAEPLATASIGQAHRARLHDGTEVVVKVRKPGVEESVLTDLEILRRLAAVAAREWSLARDVDIEGLIGAFDRSMRRELDYRTEAANAERFRDDLAEDPVVRIPRVFGELSTSLVLTEEFAQGLRITDGAALDAAGVDRRALARAATRTIVKMVMVDGFFHADPHPGNMFVRDDGCLWLIDFGMTGELTSTVREDIVRLLLAVSAQDAEAVAASLLRLAPPRGAVDSRRFQHDVRALLDTVGTKALQDIDLQAFFARLTTVLRRNHLQLPPDVSLLLRMLVLTESTAIALDPEFSLGEVLAEVAPVALAQMWGPGALLRRAREAGIQALRLGEEVPARVQRLLDDYESRGVGVHLDSRDLEPLAVRIEAVGDRLVAGMTMSSLIISIGRVAATRAEAGRGVRDPLLLAAGGATALLGTYLAAGAGPLRAAGRALKRGMRPPR